MSRESMRQELEATLTKVGVDLPPHASVESLVKGACLALDAQRREVDGLLDQERRRQERLRAALTRLGQPPGAHARTDDMIGWLIATAEARLTGPPPEHSR